MSNKDVIYMDKDDHGAWRSKCMSAGFDDISVLKEILNNLFGINAIDINVHYHMKEYKGFISHIYSVSSKNSGFKNKKDFKDSLILNLTTQSGENNNFGEGRTAPLM